MAEIRLLAPDPFAPSGLLEDLQLAGLPVTAVTRAGAPGANEVAISGSFTIDQMDEIVAVVQAHDGQPTQEQATDDDALSQIEVAKAKARQVWRGEASYTNAEAQKTIAGLVLYVTK